MKSRKVFRGVAGVSLCAIGFWLAYPRQYQQRTFLIEAEGCRMVTDIMEPASSNVAGSVVLLHGLSANKKIMSYIAEGFAAQDLRVFLPDLPGHGRTAGPFSFERAEQCSGSLLRELIARGLVDPKRSILAGHSLGGAIALRVASHVPVAAVIAISPAPMRPGPGLAPDMIPFREFGALPAESLVISAGWEPESVRRAAKELVSTSSDGTSQYKVIPRATHVSILFDGRAVLEAQKWSARVLHLESHPALPAHRALIGFLAGFAGLLFLAGPFLSETLQSRNREEQGTEQASGPGKRGVLLGFAASALGAVGLLHFWNPLRVVHLFEGDYFTSFLLVVGTGLLAWRWNSLRQLFGGSNRGAQTTSSRLFPLLAAVFAGLVLLVLFTAWFDLTFSEAWMTAVRWARFPVIFVALLPYHVAEELLLGPALPGKRLRRLLGALFLRLFAWGALLGGIFLLHSGEILLVLLAVYFGLFCVLQRRGMDIVREATGSPAAAALFGDILLAGFCLVVFPAT